MSSLVSSVQRAGATAFVLFLTCGTIPALIATTTSLGFDAIHDANLSAAWMTMGKLAVSNFASRKPSNDAEKNVAKGEMPVPSFAKKKMTRTPLYNVDKET